MKGFDISLGKSDISELVEGVDLADAIDNVSYQCDMDIVSTKELRDRGIRPGEPILLIDRQTKKEAFHGVLWDVDSSDKGQKYLSVTAYDRMKYLEESEDEYIFPEGQTAAQRIKKYCTDWGIPIGSIPDTGILLAKAKYRKRTIREMMQADIVETALKGGKMYKLRLGQKLELFEIGSNREVYSLVRGEGMVEVAQKRTLTGTVTQVKVLGAEKENRLSPVITIERKGVDEFGTIQKVVQEEKITTVKDARTAANNLLSGIQEVIGYKGIDIPAIRAGDKVRLQEWTLLVVSVVRQLGNPGTMSLTLAGEQYVRRRFFGGYL